MDPITPEREAEILRFYAMMKASNRGIDDENTIRRELGNLTSDMNRFAGNFTKKKFEFEEVVEVFCNVSAEAQALQHKKLEALRQVRVQKHKAEDAGDIKITERK